MREYEQEITIQPDTVKMNQINMFEDLKNKTQCMELVGMVKQLNSWTRMLSHLRQYTKLGK